MQTNPQPSNIIWLFADQHRAQAMSWMGDPNLSTPQLDRMAAEGVSFDRAIAPCPWCTPFRGSLLTSRHAHQAVQRTPQRLDPALPTVAQVFNQAGYRSAYFGKWHLDGSNQTHQVPRQRRGGFQDWWAYENRNAPWDNCFHYDNVHGETLDEQVDDYECDAIVDRLISYIRQRAEDRQPFFAVASTERPHDPYVAPERFMQRHRPAQIQLRPNVPPIPRIQQQARRDLAGYYAAIENIDWNLGRLRQALEQSGLAHDTWLVYFADHGDMHGSHGFWRKSNPFEESIRIPCIFGLHRPFRRGETDAHGRLAGSSQALFTALDFAPTSLGLCGIEIPSWMRGRDYSGCMLEHRPQAPVPDAVLLQQCAAKHFECLEGTWRGLVTSDGWKYVCNERQPLYLFDLNEDPFELNNQALQVGGAQYQRRAALHQRLGELLQEAKDDFPLPLIE